MNADSSSPSAERDAGVKPMTRGRALTSAGVYALVAYAFAIGVALVIGALGGIPAIAGTPSTALAYVFMLSPAIAALIVRAVRREGFRDIGFRLGRLRWYLFAWALSVGMVAVMYLVPLAFGFAEYDPRVARLAEMAGSSFSADQMELPQGLGEEQALLLFALVNLTVSNIPGILLGLGEEIGWRGHLLPRLCTLGVWPALIVGGVIWFAWHLPLGAVGGEPPAGLNMPLTIAVGLVGSVMAGGIFAWIRARSGSIFPAALCHIAFNNANAACVLVFKLDITAMQISLLAVVAIVFTVIALRGGLRSLDLHIPRGSQGNAETQSGKDAEVVEGAATPDAPQSS